MERWWIKTMTPILTIDFWNQMLNTKKELNVKNKAKKERENPALANCVEG